MISVTVLSFDGANSGGQLDQLPDTCPVCHMRVQPKLLGVVSPFPISESPWIQGTFQCPNRQCRKVLIARYLPIGNPNWQLDVSSTAPKTPQRGTYPELVAALSPTFVTVADQALAAEAAGLDQLNGIGLRKALEFLVKDLACHLKPEDQDAIEKTRLGPCIDKYIDDSNVKKTAKRATWLGNDETHYVRRWENKDIEDLKRLIRLAVNWIDNVLMTEKYEKEMPE